MRKGERLGQTSDKRKTKGNLHLFWGAKEKKDMTATTPRGKGQNISRLVTGPATRPSE